MPETILTSDQANALSGSTDATTGLVYPTALEDPWLAAFYRFAHRLNNIASLANNLRPYIDDADGTTLGLRPGACRIGGLNLTFAGDTLSSLANNNTTCVWLYESAGQPAVGSAVDSVGWPAYPHVRIAKVTVAAGSITALSDQRAFDMLAAPVAYRLSIQTQGSTATPSRIHIAGAGGDDFIRVRICDDGSFANATSATVAPAGNTTAADVVSADKDLILKSSEAGLFEIDVANAVAEAVTLRIGPAPLSPHAADYAATLVVAHAAP